MQQYTAYVEDALWSPDDSIGTSFCPCQDTNFYNVKFPEFTISTVWANTPLSVVQLQLAMGLTPTFHQCESDWNRASKLHRKRKDIVFSDKNGDRVTVNGIKVNEVVLLYREEPKDISAIEAIWNEIQPRLKEARELIREYEQKMEECLDGIDLMAEEYERQVTNK